MLKWAFNKTHINKPQDNFANFYHQRDDEVRSIVSTLDQVIIYCICRKNCKLGQNLLKHILKKLWQLGDIPADLRVPADEVEVLDELDGLDANAIKQRDRVAWSDIKKGSNHAANVCANFDNAFHACDFTHTFDCCLQCLAMGFNEVELGSVSGNLLSLMILLDFCNVALLHETQNCDGACLKVQRIKTSSLDIAGKEGRCKVL